MVKCFLCHLFQGSIPLNTLVVLNYCYRSLSKTAHHWSIHPLVITCITLVLCLGRRSLHHFDKPEEEASSLIYNYTPVYAANITGYEQLYFFWVSHSYASEHRGGFEPLVRWFRDHFHHAEERPLHQHVLPIILHAVIDIIALFCTNKHFGDEHLCQRTSVWISKGHALRGCALFPFWHWSFCPMPYLPLRTVMANVLFLRYLGVLITSTELPFCI